MLRIFILGLFCFDPNHSIVLNVYETVEMLGFRSVYLYKQYFSDFYESQKQKVKDKILWTFRIIETLQQRLNMTTINKNLKSLDQFIDKQHGEIGTEKRDAFEEGYQEFKLGFMLQQARLNQGMTQEELAEKCGTNKSYISKVENNINHISISTLKSIIETGLGGHLNLSINL